MAASWPPISVTYRNPDQNPRRDSPAISLTYVAEAPYSPPTDSPCSSRATTRSSGETQPSPVGVTAIRSDPAHIIATESVRAARRP